MKIAFVQPGSFHTWEALNIGYLASYLKVHGHHDIRFFSGFYDSDDDIVDYCRKADIIGFSCTSPQMRHALSLASQIKNGSNYIVFGGVHPSALPELTLEEEVVDAVVVGEGEKAILDIVNGSRDRIVRRDYVKCLDDLPFPDRSVIVQERNIQTAYRDNGIRIASILAGRGCPFKCVFCASKAVWSKRYRHRSAANILDELEHLVTELNIDFVKFSDDTFTLNREVAETFCEEKLRRGRETRWGCNVRVDTLDEKLLQLMSQAGCTEVWMGVESGSPRVLEMMQKSITVDRIKWAFRKTREMGFHRRAYVLLGMPLEGYFDIGLTEKLIDEIEPDSVGFTILAPYPGTECYHPHLHRDVDWSIVDEYENHITKTKYLSNEDLRWEQKRLVEKYQDYAVFRQKDFTCQYQ